MTAGTSGKLGRILLYLTTSFSHYVSELTLKWGKGTYKIGWNSKSYFNQILSRGASFLIFLNLLLFPIQKERKKERK